MSDTPQSTAPYLQPRRYGPRILALLLVLAICLWLAGFVRFIQTLPRQVADQERQTDAIVVLTGGAARVDIGLNLLAHGQARRMFITGVNPQTGKTSLGTLSGRGDLLRCCVDLGFQAHDTAGNGLETADWVSEHDYRSLRIVTANYHMPRSLVEMRRRMPDVVLVPHPVFAERVILDQWWQWPGTATLLASEFQKYLFALARFRVEAWWDRLAVQFAGRAG